MKQSICAIAALILLILAAGCIETNTAAAFALLLGMIVPIKLGGLGKKRVTCAEIERRYGDKTI